MTRAIRCAAVALLLPLAAAAQVAGTVHRVGWLGSGTIESAKSFADDVRQSLRELGRREDEIQFEFRTTAGVPDRAQALVAELIAAKAEIIVAGATPGTRAASLVTKTVPIVFVGVADPVGAGFAKSLAQPGGNITGISNFGVDTAPKSLEMLQAVIPKARRIGLLVSDNPAMLVLTKETLAAGTKRGVAVLPVTAVTLPEIENAFATLKKEKVDGLIVISDSPTIVHRVRVAELAAAARIPAIYSYATHVEAGGLMSFGPDTSKLHRLVASYLDKILKGAKPADLAIQGPTEFQVAINLQAARALDITFPPEIMMRANTVIGR